MPSRPTAAIAEATASSCSSRGGEYVANTASTLARAMAARSASSKSAPVASTGSSMASSTTSPAPRTASAARLRTSPELPIRATRGPQGSGWWATSWATSNISSRVSARMMPAWRNIASHAAAGAWVCRTRCQVGAPRPALPDFTATIGLLRATRRAMRENLRGLPIDSR